MNGHLYGSYVLSLKNSFADSQLDEQKKVSSNTGPLCSIPVNFPQVFAFSPDGNYSFIGDGFTTKLFETNTGKMVLEYYLLTFQRK